MLALALVSLVAAGSTDDVVDAAIAHVAGLSLSSSWLAANNEGESSEEPASKPKKGKSTTSWQDNGPPTYPHAGSASTPQGRQIGVGIQLGFPTALTLKYMLKPDQGIVVGVGGFTGYAYNVGAFALHVDYVYHPMILANADSAGYVVTWYFGGGAELIYLGYAAPRPFLGYTGSFYAPFWLGARAPIGVNLALTQLPFEIYLEAAPSLLIFPPVAFGLGIGIGGRFYF